MRFDPGRGATKLGDHVTLQRGTTYKSALLDQPGPVLLGLASIARNGGFRNDKLRTYGGDSAERLILGPGALYVALKDVTQSGDLLGAVARVPARITAGRLTQDTVKLTITDAEMPASYLYWLLRTPEYRAYCRARAMGTTNLSLSRDDFLAFPVPPVAPARLALVDALETLDDKIDCSRKLAGLLEDTAATLFQARFVDFVGGQDLVDTDVGPIPKGWTAQPLSALARYVNGKAFTRYGNGRGRMVIRIADLKSGPGGSTVYTDHEAGTDFIAQPGDMLFAWSGSLDVYRWYREEALINQHIFKVIPNGVPDWFVYQSLKHVMPYFQTIAADKATTMGHIKRSHLSEFSAAVPPPDQLGRWDEVFAPMFDSSLAAMVEGETLAQTRDTLLPKLVSGEIRVSDSRDPAETIEQLVEERTA